MRKIFTAALFAIFISFLSSCASNTEVSFADLNGSIDYSEYICTTDKQFTLAVNLDSLDDICGSTVFTDDSGSILLEKAELISPDTLKLHFESHGVIGENTATVPTASAYNTYSNGFSNALLSVTPSDDITVGYAFRTSDFENSGNRFSISIFQSGQAEELPSNIQLTVSNLILITFQKNA